MPQVGAPILFLVFNRPGLTNRVFDSLKHHQPSRLYVASDGPRPEIEGEVQLVMDVRSIITKVDWSCQVKTLYREKNLGCKDAVSTALDWFFSHEEEGIIIEDDCVPHPDFYSYCNWALDRFRNDQSVWHINGNNFGASSELYGKSSIAFISLAQAWGWATWSNRWARNCVNPFYISRFSMNSFKHWMLSIDARRSKLKHIEELKKGLDTWDFQWQITILNNRGLVVSPSSNLISNVGDGNDATHTQQDFRAHINTEPLKINGDNNKVKVKLNRSLNAWHEKKWALSCGVKLKKYLGER